MSWTSWSSLDFQFAKACRIQNVAYSMWTWGACYKIFTSYLAILNHYDDAAQYAERVLAAYEQIYPEYATQVNPINRGSLRTRRTLIRQADETFL